MIAGIVAIVGRPNVGKSTLFNRLTTSDAAIVDDRPGVTRDRIYGTVWLDDERTQGFMLVDTGGFETDDSKLQPFSENLVWRQTEAAIAEADFVVLLLDGKAGLTPHDRHLKRYLEARSRPHVVVVNKIDGPEQSQNLWDFFELGTDTVLKVSAAHNRGVGELREQIGDLLKELPSRSSYKSSLGAIRIAIVGRPNAGKSSILNRLTGEDRAVVSEIPGTTRDAIDTPLTYNNREYVLIDTAGIRRKSRIFERLESLSVVRSLRAIDRSDVVFLVLDAIAGLTEQDARLADLAAERGKPVAFVVNKWDLVPDKDPNSGKNYTQAIHSNLKTLGNAPVTFISATHNQRVHKLMALAEHLAMSSRRRAETSLVNQTLRSMVAEHTPALIRAKSKRVKFYFATQVAIQPPTIVVFCNVAKEIQAGYVRYMTNRFRSDLGFDNVPIRLIFRPKSEVRRRDVADAATLEKLEQSEQDELVDLDENGAMVEVDSAVDLDAGDGSTDWGTEDPNAPMGI